ncbi:MAG: hypothetical protein SPH22_09460 [Prevotella sp.]|nr:hypothetical protein [Prevotella sp.]MDY5289845.1 hypothetical protein [Prevotella sp.]
MRTHESCVDAQACPQRYVRTHKHAVGLHSHPRNTSRNTWVPTHCVTLAHPRHADTHNAMHMDSHVSACGRMWTPN